MQSTALQKLRELEEHYLSILKGVRDLIQAEGGSSTEAVKENPIPVEAAVDQSPPSPLALSHLHKGDAIEVVLRERGDLHKKTLFQILQRRGHPIASEKALNVTLSRDKRFVSRGGGKWGLANSTNGETNRPDLLNLHVPENHPILTKEGP